MTVIVRVTPRFNWQGPGHWSARRALEAVARLGADASRVAFTGHSNGAFGAWLLAALDRPAYGASAAQALSRLPDSLWLDRLDAAASASGWRHRALALRWNGTPPAAERLRQWQRNGVLPAALAREVASWTE